MNRDLAVYLHWPFCLAKCPYCDFNSHVADTIDHARWRAALVRELAHFAGETAHRRVKSMFFGGGTPSLMEAATVAAVIEAVARHWTMADDVEITLEANPTSVEAARLGAYRSAGVNRVSLGVQALNDRDLKFLGRHHSVAEARRAVALAERTFPRFSFDLIYARPGQTPAAWRDELDKAAAMAGDHMSAYQLTIEPGTAFHRDRVETPHEDTAVSLYDVTLERLAAAGLPDYEVSNHARPGAECRHNLAYWRGGDYVGVGPGAHGRITTDGRTAAPHQHRAPQRWLQAVERDGHGTARRPTLSTAERIEEVLMMGLRLSGGVERERFRAATGTTLDDALDGARLRRLVAGGFLAVERAGIRATPAGRRRLDAVLAALVA